MAYANDTDVEGRWSFHDENPLTPDITVTVTRRGETTTAFDGDDGASSAYERTDSSQFAARFRTFLLREYGDGTGIDGTWTIVFERGSVPSWTVEIVLSECDVPLDSEVDTPSKHG
ncbi:hypothetical protein [Natronococcus sp.]|uniref:hypothetical protein n=1 Tax=Natronococcus sp. TaxID=35747 RepID=UPI003A4DE0EB